MAKSYSNAAFYYISEGYQTSGKTLMGRQSAGEGFLKSYVKYSEADQFYCYGPNQAHFQQFRQLVEENVGTKTGCSFIPFDQFQRLQEVGCLFMPGPNISQNVWVRRTLNSRAYSICGVTHTTATERVMDAMGSLLIDPVQSWDAIVCTSVAVKKTFKRVLHEYADYLEERIGLRPDMPVQLPIIPLGVDCEQYFTDKEHLDRTHWRNKLEISNDDIVILYMGRLSFNAKAHPLPMFLALEEVVRKTQKNIVLILTGWFDPPASEEIWKQDVNKFCPSVKVIFLDGRQADVRREIWSAADIFTSLSDNIQETFGLTPVEAMAAGLPLVVTDWDGYRDTVRHGIDGFRVPVTMPEPGMGEDLAIRFANHVDNYGRYCGTVSQMTSVDIHGCIVAFTRLVEDQELRQRMGNAGRQRALTEYDWSNVVRQYQELWKELEQRRLRDVETVPRRKGKPAMPLRIDPFTLFQEYPSSHIKDDSTVVLLGGRNARWLSRITSSVMNSFVMNDNSLILSLAEQESVIGYLKNHKEATVLSITQLFPERHATVVKRTIGSMAKNGTIAIYDTKGINIEE